MKSSRTAGSAAVTLMCAGLLGAGALVGAPASADPSTPATAPSATPGTESAGRELTGKTVFLDPGHQGTAHSENLQRQVDDGRGGTKDCQTTGMTTVDGVPEHTINWKVSELVRSSLESLGATVKTSRVDDTGWAGASTIALALPARPEPMWPSVFMRTRRARRPTPTSTDSI